MCFNIFLIYFIGQTEATLVIALLVLAISQGITFRSDGIDIGVDGQDVLFQDDIDRIFIRSRYVGNSGSESGMP